MSKAIEDVLAERQRQVTQEGWTDNHDDGHTTGCLAVAAACYALSAAANSEDSNSYWAERYSVAAKELWPWDQECWKPKEPRRDLVRAAALIIAEIERMDRKIERNSTR